MNIGFSYFPNFQSTQLLKIIAYCFLFLVLGNMLWLDIWIYRNNAKEMSSKANTSVNPQEGIRTKQEETMQKTTAEAICGEDCVTTINQKVYEATSSLRLTSPSQLSGSAAASPASPLPVAIKEFFISLGSGSGFADDWADVIGAEATIDSTQYGSIKKVVFEATLNTPTGNQTAYARLYNVTDKHPIVGSELTITGGGAQLLVSNSIILDSGPKLYRVQIKTQLKFQTNLNQSRLHITIN